jgi:hypothetical protein
MALIHISIMVWKVKTMSTNPWFRMYAEFASDPKVQVLSEILQRRYVMLLCLQCSEYYISRPDDEIALSLRITSDDWMQTKTELIDRNLLLPDGSINGWNKRQFISDKKDPTAAERQRRSRAKKLAKLAKEPGNNSVDNSMSRVTNRDMSVTDRDSHENVTENEKIIIEQNQEVATQKSSLTVTSRSPDTDTDTEHTNHLIQTTTLAEIKNYAESTTYKENSPPTLTDIDKSESAITKRAIEIVVLLHKAAPPINSASNPHVRQWAADGVSDEKLLAALDIARDNRYRTSSHQGINSGYLDSIINAPARAPPKPAKRLPVEDYATKDYGVSHDL